MCCVCQDMPSLQRKLTCTAEINVKLNGFWRNEADSTWSVAGTQDRLIIKHAIEVFQILFQVFQILLAKCLRKVSGRCLHRVLHSSIYLILALIPRFVNEAPSLLIRFFGVRPQFMDYIREWRCELLLYLLEPFSRYWSCILLGLIVASLPIKVSLTHAHALKVPPLGCGKS